MEIQVTDIHGNEVYPTDNGEFSITVTDVNGNEVLPMQAESSTERWTARRYAEEVLRETGERLTLAELYEEAVERGYYSEAVDPMKTFRSRVAEAARREDSPIYRITDGVYAV